MKLSKIIHESLLEEKNKSLVLTEDTNISDNLKFHIDRKSTRLNSSHIPLSRMPSSA